jgi:hypothetical protein
MHHEEFYQVTPSTWNVAHLNPQFRRLEHIYSTERPHQASVISRRKTSSSVADLNQRKPSVSNHVGEL